MLPGTTGTLHLARYTSTNVPAPSLPGADQQLPEQEKGTRKRTSIPKG
jgi:phospholipase C